jgi:EmrB/QacA subfamily drug resistance transporter
VALTIVCAGQLMLTLDATIVNVALRPIQHDLHFSGATLTWLPNGYLIALGSFLMLCGRLGDLWGRTSMFLFGVAIFTFASLTCGLAGTAVVLVVARFVQGFGAAAMASGILSLIVVEFPDAPARATATSVFIFVAVAGASLGLVVGGVITQALSWHWLFFINVPVGVFVFLAGRATLERAPAAAERKRVDWIGSLLITLSMLAATTGIVRSENVGLGSGQTIGLLLAAAAVLVGFTFYERHVAEPIVPPVIMKIRSLKTIAVARGVLMVGNYGSFFVCALYFANVKGFTPQQTGLAFLPQTLGVTLMSLGPSTRLARRFGLKFTFLTGVGLVSAGLVVLALALHPHTGYFPFQALGLAMTGLGIGAAFISSTQLALVDVAPGEAGVASGLLNTVQQFGSATGVALLGTIAASHANSLIHAGEDLAASLTSGYRLSLAIGAAVVAVGLVASAIALRPRAAKDVPAKEQGAAIEPL